MGRLQGKVCVITGAGAGIGRGIAELFSIEGAKVVLSSRRETNGKTVCDQLTTAGYDTSFVKCDISDSTDVEHLFDETIQQYGRIDVLINNAGINFVKPFTETTLSDFDRVIGTDLRGTFLCTSRAVREMLKTGGGSIINITSVHTIAGMEGAAPYDAAKWGVVGLTKSLAVELSSKNIRVNALSPGLIATQIWDDIQAAAPDAQACNRYWQSNIPAGRVGTVEDVAFFALFLASDESRYVCGANLLVDGGMTSQLVSRPEFDSKDLTGGAR